MSGRAGTGAASIHAGPPPRGPGWLALVVGLSVSGALSGQPRPIPAEVANVLEQAGAALEAGRLAEAERLYRGLTKFPPPFAVAHEGLARALSAQGRSFEAVRLLLEAGQGLVHAGKVEPGRRLLERAVELQPDAPAARAALGHALLVSRDFPGAIAHLRRALALGERGTAPRLFLGSALWESGEFGEAKAVFREALNLPGDVAPIRQALGGLLAWEGQYSEALIHLRRAAVDAPGSAQLQLDLAHALEGVGEIDAAIEAYRRVTELAPRLRQARYRLAMLLNATDDREAMLQELEEFRRLHEEDQERTHSRGLHEARLASGWHLLGEGRPEEAVLRFRELQETAESLEGLAAALLASEDASAAVHALEKAVMLAPDRHDLRLRLAQARLKTRDREP